MNINPNQFYGVGPQGWANSATRAQGTAPTVPVDGYSPGTIPLPFSPPAWTATPAGVAPPPRPEAYPSAGYRYGPPDPWFRGDIQPWTVPWPPRQAWMTLPPQAPPG